MAPTASSPNVTFIQPPRPVPCNRGGRLWLQGLGGLLRGGMTACQPFLPVGGGTQVIPGPRRVVREPHCSGASLPASQFLVFRPGGAGLLMQTSWSDGTARSIPRPGFARQRPRQPQRKGNSHKVPCTGPVPSRTVTRSPARAETATSAKPMFFFIL